MIESEQVREFLQSELSLSCPTYSSIQDLVESLSGRINYLIQSDFQQLIRILYKVDVDETRLKTLLKDDTGSDAGKLIASLIVERQLQKIRTRQDNNSIRNQSEEEKW